MLWNQLYGAWPDLVPVLDYDSKVWVHIADNGATMTYVRPGEVLSDYAASQLLEAQLASSDIAYLTADRREVLFPAWSIVHARGLRYVLNPCEPLLNLITDADERIALRQVVQGASVLVMNQHEEKHLLTVLGASRWSDVLDTAHTVEVIVTSGVSGGRQSQENGIDWVPFRVLSPLAGAISVGAGDTFSGAYVAARYALGEPAAESIDIATRATSSFIDALNR
jgi:sugar/nucleoside kinase (ribokinase family)